MAFRWFSGNLGGKPLVQELTGRWQPKCSVLAVLPSHSGELLRNTSAHPHPGETESAGLKWGSSINVIFIFKVSTVNSTRQENDDLTNQTKVGFGIQFFNKPSEIVLYLEAALQL